MASGSKRHAGTSLVETSLVLALVGLLVLLGLGRLGSGSQGLTAVEGELRGCLEQALLRAQAQGCGLQVALQGPGGSLAPLRLPRGVRWGLPARGIPIPPGMDPPVRAHLTGAAHAQVPITPRHTALASVWFLTDGQDALCLRLSNHGHVQLLRWRHQRQHWFTI